MMEETVFAVAAAGLLGLMVGSFLNVVIYRLPVMMNREYDRAAKEILAKPVEQVLAWLPADKAASGRALLGVAAEPPPRFNLLLPRSRCGSCGAGIKAWQNIPVLSWLLLRGRCGSCRAPVSVRYPLVELLTGVLFGVVAWRYGADAVTAWGCVLTAFVLALTFIDADTQLLPDDLTLPLVWLGLLFNLHTGFVPLSQAVWGAVAGYMSLWTLYQTFKLLTGKEGMGHGDFKLLAAVGAWVGAAVLPVVVLGASLVGIAAALVKRVGKGQPMAFGPCLAVAGWLVFLFHNQVGTLIAWWLAKSGF
ncbi:prepilin peptidase [Conchiformibius kuhniae]|uniref:Prepilin leader peptidase/N-methyltransferase n=1 Tax=Conchiformibius kuhniae TaxID=211502 RepID=A0ABD8B885_9NEIS|nr:A24 family peptidase [Conchiformibius kuhniae]